jgi:tetratricopeptide (TPR) repeat protein
LGEASLGIGNIEEAQMWAERAKEILERCESRPGARLALQRGEYLRFRGMLAIACKDWLQAQEYLDEGEAIFRELHSQLLLARVLFQKGELAKMQANYETARGYYSQAAQIFKDIGALLDAKRAREVYQSLVNL